MGAALPGSWRACLVRLHGHEISGVCWVTGPASQATVCEYGLHSSTVTPWAERHVPAT